MELANSDEDDRLTPRAGFVGARARARTALSHTVYAIRAGQSDCD